jgi:hypothetical protein
MRRSTLMRTVITIEFDGQLRRIQAATPEDAIAELREEYEEAGPESNVDLSVLSVHCVTGVDTYLLGMSSAGSSSRS